MKTGYIQLTAAAMLVAALASSAAAQTHYGISLTKSYSALYTGSYSSVLGSTMGTNYNSYSGDPGSLIFVDGGWQRLQVASTHLPSWNQARTVFAAGPVGPVNEYHTFDISLGSADSSEFWTYLQSYLAAPGLRLDGSIEAYTTPKGVGTGQVISFTGAYPNVISFPTLSTITPGSAPVGVEIIPAIVTSTTNVGTPHIAIPATNPDDSKTPPAFNTGLVSVSVAGLSLHPTAVQGETITTSVLTEDTFGGYKDFSDLVITVPASDTVGLVLGAYYPTAVVTYTATGGGSNVTLKLAGLTLRAIAPIHINDESSYLLDFTVDSGSIG